MSKQYKFTCRIEELPLVAGYVREAYVRDLKEFQNYSSVFNSDFLEDFDKKVAELESLKFPNEINEDVKFITKKLNWSVDRLRPYLNKIEGYLKKAGDTISLTKDDFKLKEIRESINIRDTDAIVEQVKEMLELVDSHLAALQIKGYSDEARKEIGLLYNSIIEDNIALKAKVKERDSYVKVNAVVLNALWDMMKDITNTGKIIFRYDAPEKIKDYAMSVLKAKARKEAGRD
ncbi:MAG: hypothetical protein Q8880_04060 [Bacteroidota bacterium]|nr:hypothetical protein [Bacteroidota bacterium]